METITMEQIKARRAKATDPPWFVAGDAAKECGPHADSGLALVDTGRDNDWTVARLCEWPTAEFIANAPTDIDYLISRVAELEAALRESARVIKTVLLTQAGSEVSPGFMYELYAKGHEITRARGALEQIRAALDQPTVREGE